MLKPLLPKELAALAALIGPPRYAICMPIRPRTGAARKRDLARAWLEYRLQAWKDESEVGVQGNSHGPKLYHKRKKEGRVSGVTAT